MTIDRWPWRVVARVEVRSAASTSASVRWTTYTARTSVSGSSSSATNDGSSHAPSPPAAHEPRARALTPPATRDTPRPMRRRERSARRRLPHPPGAFGGRCRGWPVPASPHQRRPSSPARSSQAATSPRRAGAPRPYPSWTCRTPRSRRLGTASASRPTRRVMRKSRIRLHHSGSPMLRC
jgi:hypothetical protein